MVCRFSSKGGADVNAAATFETVGTVFCLTPTAAAGTTRVEVANNGHDFTDDGFHIEYVNVQLLRATPAYGPVKGGTRVLIEALRLIPGLYACGLGGTWTPTRWASRHADAILALPRVRGHRSLRCPRQCHTQACAVFSYVVAPRLLRMHPRTGPQLGATMLTISGQGFENHLDQYSDSRGPSVLHHWSQLVGSRKRCWSVARLFPLELGRCLLSYHLAWLTTHQADTYTYTVPIEVHATQPAKAPG